MTELSECAVCGSLFDPDHELGWHTSNEQADEHHMPVAAEGRMVKVRRERIRDRSVAHEQMGAPSKVGEVKESRWLPPDRSRDECGAWLSTGDFDVTFWSVPFRQVRHEWDRLTERN